MWYPGCKSVRHQTTPQERWSTLLNRISKYKQNNDLQPSTLDRGQDETNRQTQIPVEFVTDECDGVGSLKISSDDCCKDMQKGDKMAAMLLHSPADSKLQSSGTQISEMTLEKSSIHKTRQKTASKLKLPHRRKIEAETKRLEERKEKRRVLLQKKKEEKDIQKQEIQKEQTLAMVSVSLTLQGCRKRDGLYSFGCIGF